MASVKITNRIELHDGFGEARKLPAISKTFTGLSEVSPKMVDVGASDTVIVWDPVNWTGYPVTAFDVLIMWADQDLDVELTVGEGESDEELNSFRLAADTPLVLGADDAYRNHSASDVFAGTLDVIDKVRVKGTGTAATLNFIIAD